MSGGWDDNDESWDVGFPEYESKTPKHNVRSTVPDRIRFGRGPEKNNNDQRNDGEALSETMLVSDQLVGKIIGRGGSKIRELQERSGAKISISKTQKEDGETEVYLNGGEFEIEEARRLIDKLVNQSSSSDRNAPRSDGGGDRFDQNSESEKVLQVRTSHCGRIIGRGGSNIRMLQDESGARVDVRRRDTINDMTPVVVKGSSSCIEKAESMINDLLAELELHERPQNKYGHSSSDVPETDDQGIDWAKMNKLCKEHNRLKWKDLVPIKKNFYLEDDSVADFLPQEVEEWRANNFNIAVTHLIEGKPHMVLNPVLTFEQAFQHYPEILDTIRDQGFKKPSPIQSQAWPLAMRGYDVIGIAQTGTGKTLAFLLPIFIHIEGQSIPRSERQGPSCLILTPTRELALQIEMEIKKYHYRDIRCVCVYGGGDRKKQIDVVKKGVEIIVATPGRFNDLLANEFVSLDSVTFLVLDEADRMLDMGFEPQIMKILIDIRPDRQTMMTSATWPEGVRRLARSYLTDPMQVAVGSLDLAAVHTVKQIVEVVEDGEKNDRLLEFIDSMAKTDKVLIFVGRKSTADFLSADLCTRNIICQSIHGGREQYDREQALDDFKTSAVRILVATDVASRGLDVADVTHVFNYDYPRNTEEYVHRVGRTGRAGKSGTSITLVTREDWSTAKELIDILVEAQQEVPDELYGMAERFAKMKERRERERGFGHHRRGGHNRSARRW